MSMRYIFARTCTSGTAPAEMVIDCLSSSQFCPQHRADVTGPNQDCFHGTPMQQAEQVV